MRAVTSPAVCLISLAAVLIASTDAPLIGGGTDVHGTALVCGKPQAGVVVWVDAPAASRTVDTGAVLEQRNLDFYPRVLAVRVGSMVKFPNYDRVFHNVFSFHDGKKFDLGLYPTGTVKNVTFDRAGVSRLFCNIHPHMAAYVVAVDSPYFAMSDPSGRFVIRGVPPGTYSYQAWRPGAAPVRGSAAMSGGTELEVRWP